MDPVREDEFVGESRSVRVLLDALKHVAPTTTTVLIRGETGVGKELVARAVHRLSPRANGPFVVVDCATLHDNLLQSELFGHERGAYTGAFALKHGLFEAAHRGTLFLDEIGELSIALQVKLLRALESGTFRRLGGVADVHVDVRLVAATHRPLERMVEEGQFREDLLYRLNVFPLEVPPLREHAEDIPLLVRYFLERWGHPEAAPGPGTLALLAAYRWPGNVRELVHVLERALILCDGRRIEPVHLPTVIRRGVPAAPEADVTLRDVEIQHILRVLEEHAGHRERTAAALRISPRTLYRRLREARSGHGRGARSAAPSTWQPTATRDTDDGRAEAAPASVRPPRS